MMPLVVAIAMGGLTFLATNIDNLLLLTGCLAASSRQRSVVLGFSMSVLLVVALVILAQWVGESLPEQSFRWLGLLPVIIGVRQLLQRRGGSSPGENAPQTRAWHVALIFLGSSIDSMLALSVVLVESRESLEWLIVAGYMVAAGLATALVYTAGGRLALLKRLEPVMPYVLILVGLLVVLDSPLD